MAASWQEILLQKMWYLLKGSQSSTYSSLHWWLDWVIAHQLLTPTILGAGQVLSSRPAAHRALGPQGQELPVPPGQPALDHHFPDRPTQICQTSWLKAQLEAESPSPQLPQSISEADLCEWSILLPPSVLQNLQANPGSFPLEMHFLQMQIQQHKRLFFRMFMWNFLWNTISWPCFCNWLLTCTFQKKFHLLSLKKITHLQPCLLLLFPSSSWLQHTMLQLASVLQK